MSTSRSGSRFGSNKCPTAGNFKSAGLPVHGVKLEMHWTRESQRDPDAVKNVAIRKDPDVDIVDEDVVKVASLLVPEECVRHPNLLRVSQGEILDPS